MPSSELSVMFCYVYILRSKANHNLYIGFTHDLRRRITEHTKGLNRSTPAYAPWKLVYYEAHANEDDARRRERYLKTTSGDRAIKNMLREELKQNGDLINGKSTT